MSRSRIRFSSLCFCIALLATACQKDSPSKVPDAFEGCVLELASVHEFAKTGLADVAPDQVESVLGARLDKIGAACKPIFVEKVCSEAVGNMKQALSGGAAWLDVCRENFCAGASNHAACQNTTAGAPLLEAIWSKDYGAKAGAAMRKRVESLGIDPQKLSALLMTQVQKMLSGRITIDMEEIKRLQQAERPAPTKTIRVKLSAGGSLLIEGEGMEAIPVENVPALAGELKKLSAADVTPLNTGVTILGSETTSYQDIVNVMDQLVAAGFDSISIGASDDATEELPKATEVEDLKESAVVTISKTSVSVDGKKVADLSAGAEVWQAAMVAALKAGHPGSSTLVIQADKAVLYATIVGAIDSARPAGFVDIRFAVNRK